MVGRNSKNRSTVDQFLLTDVTLAIVVTWKGGEGMVVVVVEEEDEEEEGGREE